MQVRHYDISDSFFLKERLSHGRVFCFSGNLEVDSESRTRLVQHLECERLEIRTPLRFLHSSDEKYILPVCRFLVVFVGDRSPTENPRTDNGLLSTVMRTQAGSDPKHKHLRSSTPT